MPLTIPAAVLLSLLSTTTFAPAARADDRPTSYAFVVGSNRGGPGQTLLAYAERDAQRFADLLVELGRTPAGNIELLLAPSADEVQFGLARLRGQLEEHATRGEPTQLVFFYSGHARADGANLGEESLPLGELRRLLTAMPTTLTVVILDACQSGAFSGVKGASPAGDFSINSVDRLDTQGLAVLASSSATELSQESTTLGAGFFAHHLMVALRGAGDGNDDGRVSLDEAYRYAYERTLADTSRTRVGSQHVTLETDLKGKGDVALSFPAEASAHLRLPASLSGTLLVQQADKGAVMAEVVKAPSAPLTLALPAGEYEAVLRDGQRVYECNLEMADGEPLQLDTTRCEELTLAEYEAKGGRGPRRETWFVEVGFGPSFVPRTDFRRTLEEFEYDLGAPMVASLRAAVGWMLSRHWGVHLDYYWVIGQFFASQTLSGGDYASHYFTDLHRIALAGRASWPARSRRVVLYGDASVGLAIAYQELSYGPTDVSVRRQYGASLEAAAGLQVQVARGGFGIFMEGGYGWTPVPENLLGEKHNGLGGRVTLGVRARRRSER